MSNWNAAFESNAGHQSSDKFIATENKLNHYTEHGPRLLFRVFCESIDDTSGVRDGGFDVDFI